MEYARLTPGPGFIPAQSLMYYGQRIVTSPKLRRFVVAMLQQGIDLRHGKLAFAQDETMQERSALRTLVDDGYAPLPSLLSSNQIADIHTFFRSRALTARPENNRRFTIDQMPKDIRMADYSVRDIIEAPHILALANSPSLLRLATGYIGCKPTISALGLRWSFPSNKAGTDVQAFHRDSEDWRYLKVLVYLTDVDEETGPHVYVKGSHTTQASLRLQLYQDAEIKQKYGNERTIMAIGKAGFGFAVDTAGIHKGAVPVKAPRLMLQIQYSLLPAFAYRYEPQPYSGSLMLDPYINRLFCICRT